MYGLVRMKKNNDQTKTDAPSEEEDNSMDFEITQPSNVTPPSSQTLGA